MRYFDMHCDTLSRCADESKSIYDNDLQISLRRLNDFDYAVQFFAAYINTYKYEGEAGYERFVQQLDVFKTAADYADKSPNVHPVLTVESLSALGGKIERVYQYDIPGLDALHNIAVIRKVSPTPKKYPRRFALIKKSPL